MTSGGGRSSRAPASCSPSATTPRQHVGDRQQAAWPGACCTTTSAPSATCTSRWSASSCGCRRIRFRLRRRPRHRDGHRRERRPLAHHARAQSRRVARGHRRPRSRARPRGRGDPRRGAASRPPTGSSRRCRRYEAAQAPPELRPLMRAYSGYRRSGQRRVAASAGDSPASRSDAVSSKAFSASSPTSFRPSGGPRTEQPQEREMSNKTYVIGVGMTKFEKPGTKEWDYPDMAKEAGDEGARGRRHRLRRDRAGLRRLLLRRLDLRPARRLRARPDRASRSINVNNNCSTGSTALFLARQAVKGGLADCALALGFEKMEKGSLGVKYTDRTHPMDKHIDAHGSSCATSRPRRRAADVRQRRPRAHGAATAPSPSTSPGSAGRTTSTRSTTRTRSSRPSTRSRRSRTRR